MENKFIIYVVLVLLLVAPVMSKELVSLEPIQIDKTQLLDSSYLVKEGGVFFKDLKQIKPVVWIDQKLGTTYHVDSLKTFVENESVSLEFYYEIQPDWIKHYAHSGKYDRTFFPSQWNWTPDCLEEVCLGGWVVLEVENIEEGTGSSTFPIGITGPTWATEGQGFGEFEDGGNAVVIPHSASLDLEGSDNMTLSVFAYRNPAFDSIYVPLVERTQGIRFLMRPDNYMKAFYQNVSGSWVGPTFGYAFNDSVWYHLVFDFTVDGNITYYIDGELVFTVNNTFGELKSVSNNWQIGRIDSGDLSFDGSIDEVLIYNRSLSQAEVTALYNNYSVTSTGVNRTGTPNTEGLVLNINFDDYSVADLSGEGNHGTNTNVTFGVVENVIIALTETTDYTIASTTGLFTIVNNDYSWAWMNVSYTYNQITGINSNANSILGNTSQGITQFFDSVSPVYAILAVLVIILVLVVLVRVVENKNGDRTPGL